MLKNFENINNKEDNSKKEIESIDQLMNKAKIPEQVSGEKLEFIGTGENDVYNATAPFEYKNKEYLIARVESPDKDTDYQSIFFKKNNKHWEIAKEIPSLKLQDPFFTKINNEFIVGGVKTYPKPSAEYPDNLGYLTEFYRGTNLENLKEFAQGPELMKDLRIVQLNSGKIGVFTRPGDIFTRPQDKIGGMVGYTEIDSLEEFNLQNIKKAEIIKGLFNTKEWGGVNELKLLKNGKIGVLGHIARFNKEDLKEYCALSWEFDPSSKKISNKKIIATRANFPEGQAKILKNEDNSNINKSDYLKNIIFPGGMRVLENGKTELYAGLSDSEEGKIEIDYPFSSPIKNLKNS